MTIRRYLGLAAAGALAASLAACQPAGQSGASAAAVDPAKEEAAINAQIDAFNAASKAKDAEKAVASDAADLRGYGGGPDIASKDEDLKATKALMADPAYAFSIKAEHTEVAKSGDIAFQTGTWEGTDTNPATKKVEHATGHWVAGYRKVDGAWKLAAVSTAPPPPAPAAAAPSPAGGDAAADAQALAKAPKKK